MEFNCLTGCVQHNSEPCVQDLQRVVVYVVVHAGDFVGDLLQGQAFSSYVRRSYRTLNTTGGGMPHYAS